MHTFLAALPAHRHAHDEPTPVTPLLRVAFRSDLCTSYDSCTCPLRLIQSFCSRIICCEFRGPRDPVGANPPSSHVSDITFPRRLPCRHVVDSTINLSPAATVLHYAQSLFEGLKAYRHANGTVTMFRPDMNMKRMNTSAKRLALPVGRFPTTDASV